MINYNRLNSIRSKKLIRHAFLELLNENEYRKITVTAIVNRAEINRSTFYSHYPDIRGLMEDIEIELSDELKRIIGNYKTIDVINNPRPLIIAITDFFDINKKMFKLLLTSEDSVRFFENTFDILNSIAISRDDISYKTRTDISYIINVQYYVGGFISVYHDWVLGKIDCSKDLLVNDLTDIIIRASAYRKINKTAE